MQNNRTMRELSYNLVPTFSAKDVSSRMDLWALTDTQFEVNHTKLTPYYSRRLLCTVNSELVVS